MAGVTRTTGTTDRAAADRILTKHVADAALRKEGVIDSRQDRFAVERRKPLAEHIDAYIAHCQHAGHAPRHIQQKRTHLRNILDSSRRITTLSDVTADSLTAHLSTLKDADKSARTVNFARQIVVAF